MPTSYKSKLSNVVITALAIVSFLSAYYAIVGNSSHAQWVCLVASMGCVGMVGHRVIFKKQK